MCACWRKLLHKLAAECLFRVTSKGEGSGMAQIGTAERIIQVQLSFAGRALTRLSDLALPLGRHFVRRFRSMRCWFAGEVRCAGM